MDDEADKPVRGRPTLKTPEIVDRLLDGYRRYGSHTGAAGFVPLCPDTVIDWRHDDPDICQRIKQARAEYATRKLADLEDTGSEAYKMRMLQVVAPEEFTPINRQELTGRDGGPIVQEIDAGVDLVGQLLSSVSVALAQPCCPGVAPAALTDDRLKVLTSQPVKQEQSEREDNEVGPA